MTSLSVIGLGKLGLCTAACFAAKGFTVFAYDKQVDVLEKVRKKIAPIIEPGIEELLEQTEDNLVVVDSVDEAVQRSRMTMIIVPTPSGEDNMFINDYVIRVLEEIAPVIKNKDEFHIIDVVSTVMPGSSDNEFIPMLEKMTGKRCGVDFGLIYNPEFIAIGSVIKNFLNPDMVLIGASDEKSAELCAKVYETTTANEPKIKKMSLLNAEVTKLSVNCYVTMKISFANSLTHLCENMTGADVDVVADAVGADSRIGSKYLKGGLGFGGPCFPRDNEAMIALGKKIGMPSQSMLGENVININNNVVDRVYKAAVDGVAEKTKFAVFGLAYKPDTTLIERSQGVDILKKIAAEGYTVSGWDELAVPEVKKVVSADVLLSDDIYKCASGAGVLVFAGIMNVDIDWEKMRSVAPEARVLDCWRQFKEVDMKGFDYLPLGVGL